MTRTLATTLIALGMVISPMCAFAQDPNPTIGWDICIDPSNTAPRSPDADWNSRANDLFRCSIGARGTITYGGSSGPCFNPAVTANYAGRIGFASGPVGSVQSDMDNDLEYTFGMPNSPAGNWSYAVIRRRDPATGTVTSNLFAANGTYFAGASGRYIFEEHTTDGIHTQIHADVIGDACRIRWTMTNLNTAPMQIGMWYGAQLGLLLGDLSDASGIFGGPVYTVVPGRKPLLVDTRIRRIDSPSTFPPFIQFNFGQTNAYGLQVDTGPSAATSDVNGQNSDATNVDELVIGNAPFVVGDPGSGTDTNEPPDFIFGDVGLRNEQFLMKYEPEQGGAIAVNADRVITSYYRNTWGNSRYARPAPKGQRSSDQPYSTVVDAPHLLAQDDTQQGQNGLLNNPFTLRVYVDNTGGYSDVYTGVDLNDVRITLTLPPGLSIANGDPSEKVISVVHPINMEHVDWSVQADGIEVGDLQYTVTVTSTPGPPRPITHTGTIRVSATKQIKVEPGANLVSMPWIFTDSSWEAILGLSSPGDFTAYDWDPVQNSYVVSTSASRGKGTWLIFNPNTQPEQVIPFDPNNTTTPPDITSGAPNIQLKAGWNLIGDPYPYAFPVSQFVGVSAANPAQSFTFADLVSQNVVSPYLAYWDPTVNNYRFVQGISALIQPNKGYWIKVNTAQDLTLNFPPIFDTFVPGGRAADPGWIQSPSHWRLQIQARSPKGSDVENFVGYAAGATRALQIPEPPQGPTQDVTVSVNGTLGGQPTQLAQSITDRSGAQEWRVNVASKGGGMTTLTWPNLSSLPRGLALRIVDTQTGMGFDMRTRSTVTFNATPNSVRTFRVISSGIVSSPVIGSMSGSAGRISTNTPVTLRYTLNDDANVSIRVLTLRGQEVAVLLDGASRRQGPNTAAWDLRNSSGAVVPAGTYQLEVVGNTDDASTRKTIGVVVNR